MIALVAAQSMHPTIGVKVVELQAVADEQGAAGLIMEDALPLVVATDVVQRQARGDLVRTSSATVVTWNALVYRTSSR